MEKKQLDSILDAAANEVRSWPKWMQCLENRQRQPRGNKLTEGVVMEKKWVILAKFRSSESSYRIFRLVLKDGYAWFQFWSDDVQGWLRAAGHTEDEVFKEFLEQVGQGNITVSQDEV